MRMLSRFLLTSLVIALLAADAGEDAIQKELKRFEGTWRFVSIEVGGMQLDQKDFKNSKLILKGNEFTMVEPMSTVKGTYKVDVRKKPKHIDAKFADGPEKGKTLLGIYELEGDTYRACINVAGEGPRPTEFTSKPGSTHVLEVLKREKP